LFLLIHWLERAVTQALSHPPASHRGGPGSRPVQIKRGRICGGQSGTGAGYLRVLQFPCPSFTPLIARSAVVVTQGWYNGLIYGLSASGLDSTLGKERGGDHYSRNHYEDCAQRPVSVPLLSHLTLFSYVSPFLSETRVTRTPSGTRKHPKGAHRNNLRGTQNLKRNRDKI
jgi:hypothetical protein